MGVAALHARDSAKITFLETGLAIISAQSSKLDLDFKAALWQNLGKAETDFRQDYAKSLSLFNTAYNYYQAVGDSANRAETAIEMAKTNLLKSDYPMAKKWANDALELRKALGSRKIIECYDVLGNIAQAQGQPDSALFFYQNALKTLDFSFKNDDDLTNPNVSAKDVNQKIAFINVLSHKIGPLSILHQKTKNRRFLTAAFDTYQLADALVQAFRFGDCAFARFASG